MTQTIPRIDALRTERSVLVAEAEALLARSRSRPAMEQAIALYGRAEHLARQEQLWLLATLKSRTTPNALGARSWVEFVSTQLKISHEDARVVLGDIDALGP
jgi:hypothetical protein